MQRNDLARVARFAVRRARLAAMTAGEVTRGVSGSNDSQEAGSNGPVEIDEWATYGLTGLTLIGDGFRVRAGEKDW